MSGQHVNVMAGRQVCGSESTGAYLVAFTFLSSVVSCHWYSLLDKLCEFTVLGDLLGPLRLGDYTEAF